ncbi:sensor domain-containing diguanylate cyclase [Vibrio sp. FNV 38]|nr:sensor domain-containing diguanylate cyclase [Vibrio sp. FNV 38]
MKPLRIIACSVTILIVFVGLVFFHYYHRYDESRTENIELAITESQNQLKFIRKEYYLINERLTSSARLLGQSQSMYDYASNPTPEIKRILEQVWLSVASGQKWFRSIRALDLVGNEVIRVDYDRDMDQANVIESYTEQSNENFFKYAQMLQDHEFGAWTIELEERAEGKAMSSIRPTIKVMAPVLSLGERVGYLIIDIDVSFISNMVTYSPDPTLTAELISYNGSYIVGRDEAMLFGDVIPNRSHFNFSSLYPNIWQQMKNVEEGYHLEEDVLTVYAFIGVLPDRALYAVIQMSSEELQSRLEHDISSLIKEALFMIMLLLVVLLPIVFVLVYYYRRDMDSKLARAALNGMSAVLITDKQHRTITVNQEFQRLTGYGESGVKDKLMVPRLLTQDSQTIVSAVLSELKPDQPWEGELLLSKRDGGTISVITRIQPDYSPLGEIDYYIISFVDISERKALEERLRTLSEIDDLTGLWNRRKFEQELSRATSIAARYRDKQPSCLALIDIDHFKRINDEKGHDEGDRTIRVVGKLLINSLRTTDFVARIGGEEFALLMPHTTLEEAHKVLDRLLDDVSSSNDIEVTISAGYTDITGNKERSYKWADIALYRSKSNGRNRVSRCLSSEEHL